MVPEYVVQTFTRYSSWVWDCPTPGFPKFPSKVFIWKKYFWCLNHIQAVHDVWTSYLYTSLETRPAPPPTTKNKYVHFSVMFNPRRYTFTWAGEISSAMKISLKRQPLLRLRTKETKSWSKAWQQPMACWELDCSRQSGPLMRKEQRFFWRPSCMIPKLKKPRRRLRRTQKRPKRSSPKRSKSPLAFLRTEYWTLPHINDKQVNQLNLIDIDIQTWCETLLFLDLSNMFLSFEWGYQFAWGVAETSNRNHTQLRLVNARMDDSLKKGAEARKYAISLGSLEYSGDLAKQLLAFSDKCEKIFKALQELQQGKATSSKDYLKYFQILDEKFAWYTKAEAGLVGRDYESEYSECDPLVRYTHTGFHHATCPQLITFVLLQPLTLQCWSFFLPGCCKRIAIWTQSQTKEKVKEGQKR